MEYILPTIAFTLFYFVFGFIGVLLGEPSWGYEEDYEAAGILILWPLYLVKLVLMILVLAIKNIFVVGYIPKVVCHGLWHGFKNLIFNWDYS